MNSLPVRPFSAPGFFLGALLAAMAAAIKIFLLKDADERPAIRPV